MEISMTQLKKEVPQILNDLSEEIVITKRGTPIAKIVPIDSRKPKAVPGGLRHTLIEMGDILSPTGEKWDACEE